MNPIGPKDESERLHSMPAAEVPKDGVPYPPERLRTATKIPPPSAAAESPL